jgi:glycosyltransferase involved in cell wall biosynthesis
MDVGAEPFFSVVMPVFNGATVLPRAVASLQAQTDADWELLAVDDGSSDDSVAVLEGLRATDPRIRVLHSEPSGGPARPRNVALNKAGGQVVCFLDQDDEWLPDKLRLQRQKLADGRFGLVYGDCLVRDRDEPEFRYSDRWGPQPEGAIAAALVAQNFVPALTAALPMSVVQHIGLLDEGLAGVDDYDYWLRVAFAGYEFGRVEVPIAVWHLGEQNLSRRRPEQIDRLVRCLRKHANSDPRYRAVLRARASESQRDLFQARLDDLRRHRRTEIRAVSRAWSAVTSARTIGELAAVLGGLTRKPVRDTS